MCIREWLGHSNQQVAMILMTTVVMCVMVEMMIEKRFPGGGLELVAPAIQVKKVVPPPPGTSVIKRSDGHWQKGPWTGGERGERRTL